MSSESSDDDRMNYWTVRRGHYEELAPLIREARSVLEEALNADDDRLRFQAAKYILDRSADWLDEVRMNETEKLVHDLDGPDQVNDSVAEALE